MRRHATDACVAQHGCGAVSDLAVPAENRVPLCRDGAGAAAIAAMRRHEADAAVARARCLVLWCPALCAENQLPLYREGAGAAVIVVMRRHETDSTCGERLWRIHQPLWEC
jgi:hypothetical protein